VALRRIASALALVAVTAAIPAASGLGAPAHGTLYVSPHGADWHGCTRQAPCKSFDRAYRLATPGAVVSVAAGRYPPQQLRADGHKTSRADVVFRPPPGASVFVERINLGAWYPPGRPGASHVTFENMKANLVTVFIARDITLKNIVARSFYLNAVQDVLIKGGRYGPCKSSVDDPFTECQNSKIDLGDPAGKPNRNITIDGAVFHDYRVGNPDDHWECLIVFSGVGVTIRNSRFYNCDVFDILLAQRRPDRPLRNVLIENNWFDAPRDGLNGKARATAVAFSLSGNGVRDVLVRSNSFHELTGLTENTEQIYTGVSNFRVERNILGSTNTCVPGVTYVANVRTQSRPCNATERPVPWGYVVRGGKLTPVAAIADVIRRIFASAAHGKTPATTADLLRETGAPAPAGARWDTAAVRRILNDPVYRGRVYGARGANPAIARPGGGAEG
jgi:hypothetical protein